MPKSPQEMMEAIIRNLPKNTGKTFDEWILIAKSSGLTESNQLSSCLKTEHGHGSIQAKVVASKVSDNNPFDYPPDQELLETLYSGKFAPLRPIYDKLEKWIKSLDIDVTFSQRKTFTSLQRNRQVAVLKPATKSRFEIGSALADPPDHPRLLTKGSLVDGRRNRQVNIDSVEEIDSDLISWIKQAWNDDSREK